MKESVLRSLFRVFGIWLLGYAKGLLLDEVVAVLEVSLAEFTKSSHSPSTS
jgi:hypothetical protein